MHPSSLVLGPVPGVLGWAGWGWTPTMRNKLWVARPSRSSGFNEGTFGENQSPSDALGCSDKAWVSSFPHWC